MLSPISYKRCNAEYYVGKIPRTCIGGVVFGARRGFIHRAVRQPLSEVHERTVKARRQRETFYRCATQPTQHEHHYNHASAPQNNVLENISPLDSKGIYSATSNNTKLVHWPLTCGLLYLVLRGGAYGGLGPRPVPSSMYQMPTHQRSAYQSPYCCIMVRCCAVLMWMV